MTLMSEESTVCTKCPFSRLRCKPSLLGHKPCFCAVSGECLADIWKCTSFKTLKRSCVMYMNQYRLSCFVALSWPSCPSAHMIWLWAACSLFCWLLWIKTRHWLTRAMGVVLFQDWWGSLHLTTESELRDILVVWFISLFLKDTACQRLFVIVKNSAQGDEMHYHINLQHINICSYMKRINEILLVLPKTQQGDARHTLNYAALHWTQNMPRQHKV